MQSVSWWLLIVCWMGALVPMGSAQTTSQPPPGFTVVANVNVFIAAEEVVWNYAPGLAASGVNAPYVGAGSTNHMGATVKKAVYVQYSDATFTTKLATTSALAHKGILGPVIRAREGQAIVVTFKNKLTVSASVRPHAVFYTIPEDDGTAPVQPQASKVYTWYVGKGAAPTRQMFSSKAWTFTSWVDPSKDLASGMVGVVVVLRSDVLQQNGRPSDVDAEFFALFTQFDENKSRYLQANIGTYAAGSDVTNAGFIEGNKKRAINGFLFDTRDGSATPPVTQITFAVGQRVRWYLLSMGDYPGVFNPHFEGGNFYTYNSSTDTANLFPGSSVEVDMVADNPGQWQLSDRNEFHRSTGMYLTYAVTGVANVPVTGGANPGSVVNVAPPQNRTFFLTAEEHMWDFAPSAPENLWTTPSDFNVGSVYKKCVYMLWRGNATTGQYLGPMNTIYPPLFPAEFYHMGVLGPKLWANVGDRMVVYLTNNCSIPVSIHSEGLFHMNAYNNGNVAVQPGQMRQFQWLVPDAAGPQPGDVSSKMYMYYSTVDPIKDVHSGLLGALTINRRGTFTDFFGTGRPTGGNASSDVDLEFVLAYMAFDESLSHYEDANIAKALVQGFTVNKNNPSYKTYARKFAINGYQFDNVPNISPVVGRKTRWYVASLGGDEAVHSVHWTGCTVNQLGHNVAAGYVVPGTLSVYDMVCPVPGDYSIACGCSDHARFGETARFSTGINRLVPIPYSSARTPYFIAVDRVEWDYAPLTVPAGQPYDTYLAQSTTRIGHKYIKYLFREYTDATFNTLKPTPAEFQHKGILGPVLRATVGETLRIVFKNRVDPMDETRAFNMFIQGLSLNCTTQSQFNVTCPTSVDAPVFNGAVVAYDWYVSPTAGPGISDGSSVMWLYSSTIGGGQDLDAGLMGVVLVTHPNYLTPGSGSYKPNDVTREFVAIFRNFNENQSPLLPANIVQYAPASDSGDAGFIESNQKRSINGYLYGQWGSQVSMLTSDPLVRWYVGALGDSSDLHTPTWASMTVTYSGWETKDAITAVTPFVTQVVDMNYPQNAGTWDLHCGAFDHVAGGQTAKYTIVASTASSRISIMSQGLLWGAAVLVLTLMR